MAKSKLKSQSRVLFGCSIWKWSLMETAWKTKINIMDAAL
jgi:hypothetical protein